VACWTLDESMGAGGDGWWVAGRYVVCGKREDTDRRRGKEEEMDGVMLHRYAGRGSDSDNKQDLGHVRELTAAAAAGPCGGAAQRAVRSHTLNGLGDLARVRALH